MTDLIDLYPGYASRWIDTSIGRNFARHYLAEENADATEQALLQFFGS